MDLALRVAEIVAPVFVLAGIGYIWVWRGLDYPIAFVTRLGTSVALPCLVFSTLLSTQIDPAALAEMGLATLAGYCAVAVITFAAVALLGLAPRTYLAPLIFGNTGNLGLPLALFAFGETGLGYAIVLFAVMSFGTFTVGIWMIAGRGIGLGVLREPIVGACLLAAAFLGLGWSVPVWIGNSVALIGQLSVPLMLLTLGVAVARLRPAQFTRALALSLGKATLGVSTGLTVGWLFDLPPLALAVLVLQMTTPVAVTSYLLAEKYGAEADAVAGLVVVSTLLAILTLPLLIGFLMPL